MLNLTIPGFGALNVKHVIFDYNGTLALDGKLIPSVKPSLVKLTEHFKVHVVTGDSLGTARAELAEIDCEVVILPVENQSMAKANYIIQHDPDHVIAVGNGRNDQQMLQIARLGIAVLGEEGLAVTALSSANIVVPTIFSVFELLKDNARLTATLRS